jgi:hypothetical protein
MKINVGRYTRNTSDSNELGMIRYSTGMKFRPTIIVICTPQIYIKLYIENKRQKHFRKRKSDSFTVPCTKYIVPALEQRCYLGILINSSSIEVWLKALI